MKMNKDWMAVKWYSKKWPMSHKVIAHYFLLIFPYCFCINMTHSASQHKRALTIITSQADVAANSSPGLFILKSQTLTKYKPGLICNMAQFGVFRALPTVDTQSCCLIRPASGLIVRSVVLVLCADYASSANAVISRAKHSMKRAGQWLGWPPTGIHGRQSRHAMRAGGRKRQFCIFLPAISVLPLASLIQLLFHPPLASISECGTMSYGMAETAEVMDTDRMHTVSCGECKWVGLSAVGS